MELYLNLICSDENNILDLGIDYTPFCVRDIVNIIIFSHVFLNEKLLGY